MRCLLLLFVVMRLEAQNAAAPVQPPAASPAATAPAQAPATKPDEAGTAASPVPTAAEPWLTGSIDLGYRWRSDVGGSFDTYRSIVNLGSGPKLLGTEFTVIDPKRRLLDRVDVHAYSWGDDPYGTFHLRAVKKKLYDFNADYRDLSYFNFLPSFADPLLTRGIVLNQQSFDLRRHLGSFQLDLLPGNWLIPYIAYDRDSGFGRGVATFVSDGNQYPVPNSFRDLTNLFRGGVRIELRRLHATLEQGRTTFRDDQSLFQGSGTNYGDVTTPVLGQILVLDSALAAYGIRGTSIYSKILLSGNAFSWLDLYGQFLYSRPENDVSYQQAAAGNLYQQNPLLFYSSQQFILSAEAKMPHTTGNASAEIRPHRTVRILQSWLTDRLHNSAAANSFQRLTTASAPQVTAAFLDSELVTNYNQFETDVIWDAYRRLSVRGGYRRVWGDASQLILPPAGLASSNDVQLSRNVVLGGFTFRATPKLSITGEAEGALGGQQYFRTSLRDYQMARGQVRYQASPQISISGDFYLLSNQNPAANVQNDYLARQESISVFWTPPDGKPFDVQVAYSRSTLHSDILFLVPQDLSSQESIYRDNSHIITSLWNFKPPQIGGLVSKLTAGGSFFISSGSRPTTYYQPFAKLSLPINKQISWFAEWRYYGFGETFYPYENFHAHTVTGGVRIVR
ncbi:MAG TPA: hypothetical protein VG675_07600 [Bryobacteraceae bacterium]|nr:hypothetical protein [Bryobacteraceae bacterium]